MWLACVPVCVLGLSFFFFFSYESQSPRQTGEGAFRYRTSIYSQPAHFDAKITVYELCRYPHAALIPSPFNSDSREESRDDKQRGKGGEKGEDGRGKGIPVLNPVLLQ